MKITLKNTWIAACLFSGIFLSSCTDRKDQWYPIPGDCAVVAVVDASRLSQKVLKDKLSDFSFFDLFDFSEDTLTKKDGVSTFFENPSKIGIQVASRHYLFKKERLVGIAAPLENEEDFANHVQNTLKKEIRSSLHYNYTYVDSLLVAWNTSHCLFLIREDLSRASLAQLESILKIKKEASVFAVNSFIQTSQEESDLTVWFSIRELLKDQPISAELTESFTAKNHSSLFVDFEEGKINLRASDFLNPTIKQLLGVPLAKNNTDILSADGKGQLAVAALYLDMEHGLELIKRYSSEKHLEKIGLKTEDLTHVFSGEILLSVYELVESKNIFTSYEFDEDFNKIEVKDTVTVRHPKFSLFIGSLDSQKTGKLLHTLSSKNLLDSQKAYYSFSLAHFPVNFYNLSNGVLITNEAKKEISPSSLTTETSAELSKNPFTASGNPSAFAPLLKDSYKTQIPLDLLDDALVKMHKDSSGNVFLTADIHLKNKEQNSLLTILDLLKSMKQPSL